jgi:hypothetical protein
MAVNLIVTKFRKFLSRKVVGRSTIIYCHAFSDRRRVLEWQLDLLQSYTQVQYNWVSPDSLSLPTHDWIYHNNSVAIVTAATLVTGELQVPFLFPGYQLTHSPTQTLQQLPSSPKTTPNSKLPSAAQLQWQLSEVYDLWTDCRGDSAFGIGCLAIT